MDETRPVVLFRMRGDEGHDAVGRRSIAQRLAASIGGRFAGDFDDAQVYSTPPYFVPDDALPAAVAKRLGIGSAGDLFGGVVPHDFVATKAITHGLVSGDAHAPEGWSTAFASRVEGAVLRGFTAFTREEAMRAIVDLLAHGPVRVKRCDGIGGGGQQVVGNVDGAKAAIAMMEESRLAKTGLVIEQDLAGVTTYSVGQVTAGGVSFSYCGTQQTTRNGAGADVYGGSTLDVVRGGFEALDAIGLPEDAQRAVELAKRYDEAAFAAWPALIASRRNYDVARGIDGSGAPRVGVLEQSWRVGGASGAEVRAVEAFLADETLARVRASTRETYEVAARLDDDAFVYFRGVDAHGTPLVKYATLETDADA